MESVKTLVSKDRATRVVSAHVVPLKGAVVGWVIQQCARDLERLGHCGQITLKSDQEAAVVDVLKEIANLRASRGTLSEHSPVADSQSNGCIERERWHLRTWLGQRFHTEEHLVARKGDGFEIRSRAAKAMPKETTMDDLDAIKGLSVAPSGVLRDVLPDGPRPILSRDEPPFVPVEERPVPKNMNFSQDILKKFGHTAGCAKCRKFVS